MQEPENVVYDVIDEPLVISKSMMDLFLGVEKGDEAGWLYMFYYYTAKWQHTNQIRATVAYTMKGLGWTEEKVLRSKKRLKELGLIEDVQQRDPQTNQIKGWYLKLRFIWGKGAIERTRGQIPDFPGPGRSQVLAKPGPNALSDNTGNALSDNNKTKDILPIGSIAARTEPREAEPAIPTESLPHTVHRTRTRPVVQPSHTQPSQPVQPSRKSSFTKEDHILTTPIVRAFKKYLEVRSSAFGDAPLKIPPGDLFKWKHILLNEMRTRGISQERLVTAITYLENNWQRPYTSQVTNLYQLFNKLLDIELQMRKSANGNGPRNGNWNGGSHSTGPDAAALAKAIVVDKDTNILQVEVDGETQFWRNGQRLQGELRDPNTGKVKIEEGGRIYYYEHGYLTGTLKDGYFRPMAPRAGIPQQPSGIRVNGVFYPEATCKGE